MAFKICDEDCVVKVLHLSYDYCLRPLTGNKQSVQFSCSVVSNSLWPHGLKHARLPCPSPTPRVVQTHVHWFGDAIQSSHPLLSPSSPAPNPSQHQGLFQWVCSLHQVAKVLESQLQHQSFQWIFPLGSISLGFIGLISLQSRGLSRVFSNTTVQKHQFFDTQLSLWPNSDIHTWLLGKP